MYNVKITNNRTYSALLCGTLFVQASLPTGYGKCSVLNVTAMGTLCYYTS